MGEYLPVDYAAIEEYLKSPDTRINEIIHFDKLIGQPMHKDCIAGVIVPAHNESLEICAFLDSINAQVLEKDSELSQNSFEILIIDNNSADGTAQIVNEYISKNGSVYQIKIISVDFPEEEKGVGTARRLGTDLEIYRAFKDKAYLRKEFYFIGLDSDEPIPCDHFIKAIRTFREKRADVLAGNYICNVDVYEEDSRLRQVFTAAERYRLKREYEKPSGKRLYGGNYAMTVSMYCKIGGCPRIKAAEDTYMGVEAEKHNAKICTLDSIILDNPRKMLADPLKYITREAWGEDEVLIQTIRTYENREYNYSTFEIKKALTAFLDDMAHEISVRDNITYEESLSNERTVFWDIAHECGLDKSMMPDDGLFWFHRLNNYKTLRTMSPQEDKQRFILEDMAELSGFEHAGWALTGQAAAWYYLKDGGCKAPSMVSIYTFAGDLAQLIDLFSSKGFSLFEVVNRNKLLYYKKIEAVSGDSLVGHKNLFFIKVNRNGIIKSEFSPLYQLNLLIFEKNSNGIKPDERELFFLPEKYADTVSLHDGMVLIDKVFLMYMLSGEKNAREYLDGIYSTMTKDEQDELGDLLNRRFLVYYKFFMQQLRKAENKDDIRELAAKLLTRDTMNRLPVLERKISEAAPLCSTDQGIAAVKDILNKEVIPNYFIRI